MAARNLGPVQILVVAAGASVAGRGDQRVGAVGAAVPRVGVIVAEHHRAVLVGLAQRERVRVHLTPVHAHDRVHRVPGGRRGEGERVRGRRHEADRHLAAVLERGDQGGLDADKVKLVGAAEVACLRDLHKDGARGVGEAGGEVVHELTLDEERRASVLVGARRQDLLRDRAVVEGVLRVQVAVLVLVEHHGHHGVLVELTGGRGHTEHSVTAHRGGRSERVVKVHAHALPVVLEALTGDLHRGATTDAAKVRLQRRSAVQRRTEAERTGTQLVRASGHLGVHVLLVEVAVEHQIQTSPVGKRLELLLGQLGHLAHDQIVADDVRSERTPAVVPQAHHVRVGHKAAALHLHPVAGGHVGPVVVLGDHGTHLGVESSRALRGGAQCQGAHHEQSKHHSRAHACFRRKSLWGERYNYGECGENVCICLYTSREISSRPNGTRNQNSTVTLCELR
mmetsp:Transcript_21/g.79  ORF Transcript_21/g.79 Transcript_21/m.79 type:complete len:452 (+) Transcript_21:5592-6947(+)